MTDDTARDPAGHRPTDDAVGPICVVCHENWPCAATPANPAGLRERIEALTRYKPRPFSDGGGMGPHADGGWLAISDVRAVLAAPVAVDVGTGPWPDCLRCRERHVREGHARLPEPVPPEEKP